jgi:pyruvate dehydrogenase E1 component alpha subunit
MHLSDRGLGLWPTVAIVGAQLPIAVGAALASQARADGAVTVAVFGDGAANIGAFHEALNLAGLWALPVVFVCENNLYAEYSRIDATTALPEIASRAAAYAMPGVTVDGQRLDAVRAAMTEAVDRARAERGPTLIEAQTYRFVGHSRSDPAKYRRPGELEAWKARDPIRLTAAELQPSDPDGMIAAIRSRWEAAMAAAVETVKAAPEPVTQDMFRHVYARGSASNVLG